MFVDSRTEPPHNATHDWQPHGLTLSWRPELRALVVEPLAATRRMLCEMLQQRGFVVGEAADADAAVVLLQREPWGLVIFDGAMPEHESLRFCRWVRAHGNALLVALTSIDDPVRLPSLLEAGIDDALIRPLDHRVAMLRLQLIARRVSERMELLRCTELNRALEQRLGQPPADLVAHHPVSRQLADQARLAAQSDAPVLLTGEAGSGKEYTARIIHGLSGRRTAPFVMLDPTACADSALEQLLYGHARGHEGQPVERRGLLEAADGGTLFVTEAAALSPRIQALLVQSQRERLATRLGSTTPVSVDVRLMVASRHTPDALGALLRDDFYWAVRVFDTRVPSVRERRDDLIPMAIQLLADASRARQGGGPQLSRPAMERLMAWHWPGNVRELRNVLAYAMAACDGQTIQAGDLPDWVAPHWVTTDDRAKIRTQRTHAVEVPAHDNTDLRPETVLAQPRKGRSRDDERTELVSALVRAGGVRSDAADLLGISRVALWKKMKRLGVDFPVRVG